MLPVLAGLLAGAALVLAFPPFGWAWISLAAIALLLWALRSGRHPTLTGWFFGLAFFGGLIWWISELGLVALIPAVLFQSSYFALYGWLMGRAARLSVGRWMLVAIGGWAAVEWIRGHFPVGGYEWGQPGLSLSGWDAARGAAQWIGGSGWSVLVVAMAAAVVMVIERRRLSPASVTPFVLSGLLLIAGALWPTKADGPVVSVAIVQGSTPCPFTHCDEERLQTMEMHLALTEQISAGAADLVVWAEGSAGSSVWETTSADADPIQNDEVGEAIGDEAERIGAYMLIGTDRAVGEDQFVNANVLFGPDGEILGEYRKRHPVPFGEYVPFRSVLGGLPALEGVPRDMIRGEGPVVFDTEIGALGSVISFEGSFSRYPRSEVGAGAELLVVATNEGSYGYTPASDQLIGITRMRAAELGIDVVHAAVTGKSTFITEGGVVGETLGLAESDILYGSPRLRTSGPTLYARLGDWMVVLAALAGAVAVLARRPARPQTP